MIDLPVAGTLDTVPSNLSEESLLIISGMTLIEAKEVLQKLQFWPSKPAWILRESGLAELVEVTPELYGNEEGRDPAVEFNSLATTTLREISAPPA